jgi:RHS repeat-associated protein
MRFARRALALLCIALAVAATIPVVSSSERGRGDRGKPPAGFAKKDTPRIPSQLMQTAQRPSSRSTAAQRKRSRAAHRGRSSKRALRLLRERFPQVAGFADAAGPQVPAGARIDGYLGDYATRITLPKSLKRRIVLSPLPVRARDSGGRKRVVSLGLRRADGEYEPINPLVEAGLPQVLGDGFTVGDEGLRVLPTTPEGQEATGTPTSDQVFYANTATDSDTLLTPAPSGVEVFTQLRSADAPESHSLAFHLEDGAALRATRDGGAEVVRNDTRIARVLPPAAADADGVPVPVRYAVSGNRLTVTTAHRGDSYAYPILVDPLIEDWGSQSNWQNSWFYNPNVDQAGWFFADSPAWNFAAARTGIAFPRSYGDTGYGLYIGAPADTYMPAGSYGQWLWRAPGETTFIPRADFGLMYRDTQADAKNQSVVVDGIYSDRTDSFVGYHQFPGRLMGHSDTVVPGDNVRGADPRAGNIALFGLTFPFDHKRRTWTTAYLGGAGIHLDDPEAPTITSVERTPEGGWINPATARATVTARDPGLGVAKLRITTETRSGGQQTRTTNLGCGDRFYQCQGEATAQVDYAGSDFPDGTSTVSVAAEDPLGKVSPPATWEVKVDRSDPVLEPSGPWHDAADQWVDGASDLPLKITARDGDASSPSSGIRSAELWVNGQRVDRAEQDCESGNCSLERDFTFRPSDYPNTFNYVTVVATDQAGNTTSRFWQTKIDRGDPSLWTSGSLKEHQSEWLDGATTYKLRADTTDGFWWQLGSGVKSIEMQVDGRRVDQVEQQCDSWNCGLGHEFSFRPDDYDDGIHTVTLIATDHSGRKVEEPITAKTDGVAPTFTLDGALKQAEGQELTGDAYGLSIDAFDGASGMKSIEVKVDGQRRFRQEQPCATGGCPMFESFSFETSEYTAGEHVIHVIVSDHTGRTAESSWSVTVPPRKTGTPAQAPALDPTRTTDIARATSFLYTGENPVQTGVTDRIEPIRAAVLRGKVRTRDGNPLSGVRVSVVGHPGFGSTTTGANGEFYMAVNGGGQLRLRYERDGFLSSERTVEAPWRDYAFADDVVLIPLDDAVTEIDLGSSPLEAQVARASEVVDDDGRRRETLIFKPGTQAQMVLPGGDRRTLQTLNVRTTEYTVGDSGPEAMPGELPPTSAYTYAVEHSVDEAMAAGAEHVEFSQPVVSYVENFLGFQPGIAVPLGYYDRAEGAWIPMPNGRVVKVLSEADGRARLDVWGGGQPATASELAQMRIDDTELRKVAELYEPGQTLWRMPFKHFTPADGNHGARVPPGARYPDGSLIDADGDGCADEGSVIGCDKQSLGESVPLTGADMDLTYESTRAPGSHDAHAIKMRVSGPEAPHPALRKIHVTATVAGRRMLQTHVPAPNKRIEIVWDGKDAFGREVRGAQPVRVELGYEYEVEYATAVPFYDPNDTTGELYDFGQPPEPENTRRVLMGGGGGGGSGGGGGGGGSAPAGAPSMPPARGPLVITRRYEDTIGEWDARAAGLGGWTLTDHHAYDPVSRKLHLGDGTTVSGSEIGRMITTIAKPGDFPRFEARGGIDVGPDGSVYIADFYNDRVLRRAPNGEISTFAGNPPNPNRAWEEGFFGGDGGPATQAQLNAPTDVEVQADGGVLIVDYLNHRVRRVAPNGIITTAAGTGGNNGFGDGGDATRADFYYPVSVESGPDGSFYVADKWNQRIRKVDPAGTIVTVFGAGPGAGCLGSDCGEFLGRVRDVAVTPDGTLYAAAESWAGTSRLIRKRPNDPRGVELMDAGRTGGSRTAEGVPIGDTRMDVAAVAPGPDNSLYVVDRATNRVRRMTPDGRVNTVAGGGSCTQPNRGDGGPALQACLPHPAGVAVAPDGGLYVTDWSASSVRRIGQPMPGFQDREFAVAAPDGSEVYRFDKNGRHLDTRDGITGAKIRSFAYDHGGRLVMVEDESGNDTRVERDASGKPSAVVGPYGARNEVALNAEGYLERITNPASESFRMGYGNQGLLTSLTDPEDKSSVFEYESDGRLKLDRNAAGNSKSLSRTEPTDGQEVTVRTGLGRATKHRVEQLPNGDQRRTVTEPDGASREELARDDATSTIEQADGTTVATTQAGDPRFGLAVPFASAQTLTTPGGRGGRVTRSSEAQLLDPSNPFSVESLTRRTSENGKTTTSRYERLLDSTLGRFSETSPEGRTWNVTADRFNRPRRSMVPGLAPVDYSFDQRGRLASTAQGGRTWASSYDANGNVSRIDGPEGWSEGYRYDGAGRLTNVDLRDGRSIGLTYDRSGNVTAITPPGRLPHDLGRDAVGRLSSYAPPHARAVAAQPVRYRYDGDGDLEAVARSGGSTVELIRDSAGRVERLRAGGEDTTIAYGTSGARLPERITTPRGQALSYEYDGSLFTRETYSGPISGSVGYTYNNDLAVAATTVNGGHAVGLTYDADGMLVHAGQMSLSRDPANGVLTGTTLGSVVSGQTYDVFGQLETLDYSAAGAPALAFSYDRDGLDRKTRVVETAHAGSHELAYSYDDLGRVESVTRDGLPWRSYEYDANGNRISESVAGALPTTSTYDEQDRLVRRGSSDYDYSDDGELTRRRDTTTGAETTYGYNGFGELERAALSDGTHIDYVLDGLGRRVGKRRDGALVQGLLYGDRYGPLAELAGDGSVRSRFVYGGGGEVPFYMVREGRTYRLVTDDLGSVRQVVDAQSGEVAQELDYDPYGRVLRDTRPGFQPFGYAAGLYDPDTGFVRFGARDYDPETGRWTSKDPIGFAGGDTNLYGYVFADPVNGTDPSGLAPMVSECAMGALDSVTFGLSNKIAGVEEICSDVYRACGTVADLNPKGALKKGAKVAVRRARRDGDLPARGRPNSSDARDDGRGNGQIRDYGDDGRAKTDFDFGHDHGAGDPHAHDWDWSQDPPRQPGRPIRDDD